VSRDRELQQRYRLAGAVREACVEAAVRGYHEAAASGLCGEGALEAAVSAVRMLDLERLVADSPAQVSGTRSVQEHGGS